MAAERLVDRRSLSALAGRLLCGEQVKRQRCRPAEVPRAVRGAGDWIDVFREAMLHGQLLQEDADRENELLGDFAGRLVEGLIVVPAGDGTSALGDGGITSTVPLVLATRTVDGVRSDAVLVDDVGGAEAGTASLIEDGHRCIAFLGDVSGIQTARRRYEGFLGALRARGLDFDDGLLHPVRDTEIGLTRGGTHGDRAGSGSAAVHRVE